TNPLRLRGHISRQPTSTPHSATMVLHIVSGGGDRMAATSHTSIKRRDGLSALAARWPFLGQRRALVAYIAVIVIADLAAMAGTAAATPFRWHHLLIFAALMGCGAVCIEATRRLGMPSGVSRDLL